MVLRTTIDGWCPTTPTLPRCLMHILTPRCPSVFGVSNTFLRLQNLDRVVAMIVNLTNEIQQYIDA